MQRIAMFALAALAFPISAHAQLGSSFTYQGQINNGSSPVENLIDVRYTLLDSATTGTVVGSPILVSNTAYEDGVINAELDFGDVFDGTPLFLEVEIANPSGSSFVALDPRVALAPVPYANFATAAGTVIGGVDDSDADATNELQALGGSGSQVTLSGGGGSVRVSGLSASDGNPTEVVSVDGDGNITVSGPIFLQDAGSAEETLDQAQTSINTSQTVSDFIQSFTPGLSGDLTSIDVRFSTGSTATTGNLIIYEGSGTGGTELANQPYTPSPSTGVTNYVFSPASAVNAGEVYTFRFMQTSGGTQSFSVRTGNNPYAGGELLSSGPNDDAVFRTYVTPAAAGGGIEFPDGSVQTTAFVGVDEVDDADSDPANELQTLGGSGSEVTLTDGASVKVSALSASDGSLMNIVSVEVSGNVNVGGNEVVDQSSLVSGGSFPGNNFGQSFTAGADGLLTAIEFRADVALDSNATMTLRDGDGVGGPVLSVVTGFTALPNNFNRFDFTPPVPVQAGMQYSFLINNPAGSFSITISPSTDPYSGGSFFSIPNRDLFFNTYMNPNANLDVAGIVTAEGFVGDGSGLTNLNISVDDADADPTNELQDLSSSANNTDRTINISGGTGTTFNIADDDSDPTNELLSNFQLIGTQLEINDAAGTKAVDLSGLSDADGDPANELQNLSFSSPNLSISDGNSVDLSGILSGITDNVEDADADPSNELLNNFQLVGTQLEINDAAGTKAVDLSGLSDADGDPTNELQDLSSSANGTNRTINISGGTGTTINVADNDSDSSNELQKISSVLSIGNDAGGTSLSNLGNIGIGSNTTTYPITVTKAGTSTSVPDSVNDAKVQVFVNATDETGGGIAISNEGGFFDLNDNYITFLPLGTGVGLRIQGELRILNQAWPDYVFEDGYVMAPLSEVERHIDEKGHLPNVPSAEVIHRDGVPVSEMNAILLRQIEELTLRMIDMEKELNALKAEKERGTE